MCAVVVVVEAYLFSRYRALGAEFHFWLHGLFGAALGVGALTVVGLIRRKQPKPVWTAGLAGHLYSAFPDVLFLAVGVLHYLWMDVFAFHIALHFIPAPLITMFVVFALTLAAWALATAAKRRASVVALTTAVTVTAVALILRAPLPDTLEDVRETPEIALLCPLTDVQVAGDAARLPP